jgi:hypothetical protein
VSDIERRGRVIIELDVLRLAQRWMIHDLADDDLFRSCCRAGNQQKEQKSEGKTHDRHYG